ncbi:phosphate/phosphite/phosphonate ABC transporter substrate-binding protein [Paenibacillus qinlingensis]|uniref:phosphate/phosphite/phosphonate ABC transporter substrate-binding protein n=1 Tax=Paenibacillus qinlingensis TaxID=1837343 RepID=UPI001563AD31|nr:phosphate/phosphite/phosphonate ABC transporter substrate-binding protein [Paenibacillus qinlingensis]NQX60478.1 phosphate/phosphite/phosphonate ABC transporter substrate-binding protein [Paenibacillus qinlingensis]
MNKKMLTLMLSLSLVVVTAGCGTNAQNGTQAVKTKDTITIGWFPNESGADMKISRDEIGKVVAAATGKKVEHKTTTDYTIAIEAIASGSADIIYTGAQAYVEANAKNKKVQPLVVPSGESGTLDDAVYNSWLNVRKGDGDAYKVGSIYSMDNIAGKKFSFVSNSSTSGFKIPSGRILTYFTKKDKYKNLTVDDLLLGGKDKFFSDVLFGGTHQGSAVNLLNGKADVAAFCDTCVANYIELSSGTENTPGAVYKVKQGAAEPFNTQVGKEFEVISVTPVLNQPIVINTGTVSVEDTKKIKDALTSDAVTNNPLIFIPKDSKEPGMFKQKTGKEKFLGVDDAFFNPIRTLYN